MSQDVDLNKVVRQHLEAESFFTGFSVKGKTRAEGSLPSNRGPDAQDTPEPRHTPAADPERRG